LSNEIVCVIDARMTTIAYGSQIASAAARHALDARLLAAVAAQETGGPGSSSGRNIVGDGGHGRGVFQIDDRYHAFARTAAAMDPGANADYAAGMLASLIKRYGGDVHKALSAYNSGDPNARGSQTTWGDGERLGYADSVLRHYADLNARSAGAPSKGSPDMGFSLGNIFKGVVAGVETLVTTANPIAAAGAGAAAAFSGSTTSSAPVQTFDPTLDELSANLNPGSPPQIYSYSQLAGINNNGQSTNGHSPDLGSIVFSDSNDDDATADI
jgi:hypothetical protein